MVMKIKLTISLLFSLLITLQAQDARAILDKASAAYNNAGGITASFTIKTEDSKNKITYNEDGQATLKGNKFKMEVTDGITWFDGKTQWVYAKGSDEVNISNPTNEELAAVSPIVLLNIYKNGFNLKYIGDLKENGKTVSSIELTPQNSKSEYSKMVVNIDKATNMLTSIRLTGKNKINNHLVIKKIQSNKNITDNTFTFNKKEYPKVEIIDLR